MERLASTAVPILAQIRSTFGRPKGRRAWRSALGEGLVGQPLPPVQSPLVMPASRESGPRTHSPDSSTACSAARGSSLGRGGDPRLTNKPAGQFPPASAQTRDPVTSPEVGSILAGANSLDRRSTRCSDSIGTAPSLWFTMAARSDAWVPSVPSPAGLLVRGPPVKACFVVPWCRLSRFLEPPGTPGDSGGPAAPPRIRAGGAGGLPGPHRAGSTGPRGRKVPMDLLCGGFEMGLLEPTAVVRST